MSAHTAKGRHQKSWHSSSPPLAGVLAKWPSCILKPSPEHSYNMTTSKSMHTAGRSNQKSEAKQTSSSLIQFHPLQQPKIAKKNDEALGVPSIAPSTHKHSPVHKTSCPPEANHAVGWASCWSVKPLWAWRTGRGVAPKPPWLKFKKPCLGSHSWEVFLGEKNKWRMD